MIDLLQIAKFSGSINSLLTGGALETAFQAISVVELKAAKDAFQAINKSKNPREALNRVLTHLETAHISLQKSWSFPGIRFTRMTRAIDAALWDAYTCCLIATIHKALGDNQDLIVRAFGWADNALRFEESIGDYEEGLISLFNPIAYFDIIFSDSVDISKIISRERYSEFKKEILL